jgi:hypothetical protein
MFTVALKFTSPPLVSVRGFAGDRAQIAPASAVTSHVALIFPAYEKEEVNFRLAVTCAPGAADKLSGPEME